MLEKFIAGELLEASYKGPDKYRDLLMLINNVARGFFFRW